MQRSSKDPNNFTNRSQVSIISYKMSEPKDPEIPPTLALFLAYSTLGAALSYFFGRNPVSEPLLPDNLILEIAPTIIVISLFLVSYSLVDVMEVGKAKIKAGLIHKQYPASALNPPETVYVAQRAQMNQIEQLPGFLIGSICFAVLVDGKVGAVLSLIWSVARRLYASTYLASVGKPMMQAGLTTYTVPAYFIVNSLLMGAVAQCVRILMSNM